jgi:spermidine synthase
MTHFEFPIRSTKLSMKVEVSDAIYEAQTRFQKIQILDTPVFGRILLLDEHIQLAEFDEFAYHESLVHIPLLSILDPKRALVVGGGDGGVLRELCRHRCLERIDMVEIDEGVIEACRVHMPSLSDGAFEDPRVQLHIADAFPFMKEAREPYDLIIMDVTDVYEEEDGELSEQLFTQAFFEDCLHALTPKGLLVSQADNHVFCPYSLAEISREFSKTFAQVGSYQAIVPSFGGYSAFCWAGKCEIRPTMPPHDLSLRYLSTAMWNFALAGLPFQVT